MKHSGSAAEAPAKSCRFSASCGTDQTPTPGLVAERIRNHPCFSEEAHHHFARMHVAVAPACNLQCHYCNRKFDCANESRPGVSSERLTPEQAARKVLLLASAVPQLSVVGIAGPGDPLANPEETFETLDLVRKAAPDLRLCVSTNGLSLPEHVETLAALGVDHLTVTINMVDPAVGERIYPWLIHHGRKVRGPEASILLSERQLEGVRRAVAAGMLVKVNSVVIPGVNDRHLVRVSREVKALGVLLHNLMPLISEAAHGTYYGLGGQRGPTPEELDAVQRACEANSQVMRHCRQCRADAVGLLGEDQGQRFALARLPPEPVRDAAEVRAAYRESVEAVRKRIDQAREESLRGLKDAPADLSVRVAVATKGGGLINQHFGHAREFQVYEVSKESARFVGPRRIDHYCLGGEGDEVAMASILAAVSDCAAILVSRIGRCPQEQLAAAGVEAVEAFAHQPIEAGALAWFRTFVARARAAAPAPELQAGGGGQSTVQPDRANIGPVEP
ncbi:MAG: nitrogenase cofactor biosynthesis protein NifB [Myxococcales bacterium]|nr:nitrogenase cofactor biosynthesis protein NifB [Myxococcales bacterium]